ncbi:P-loop containing nucleoside triphosphate hydrolase protein [Sphaerosporella brunnea]|uniref:P-loop containing nucleoside triphosphate hydrolase protein n=1 Tax=Sphaerosporella brunnea TaxID=1250544 RepID=A0A5J5F9C4_9PEZI|nr:P-loop containing nucleoside triphosphate hydrolase protein [Sphaerosporella brunnea]
MKAKSFSSLQKSYDQAYLTSSTAAYYESLSQPHAALETWRKLLSQLSPAPALLQKPRSDTEASLLASLQKIREQAEHRAQLLSTIINTAPNEGEVVMPPMSPPVLPERPPTAGSTLTPAAAAALGARRSPSPDSRRMFLSTLRTGKKDKGKRESGAFESLRRGTRGEAAAQAATLAWSSISRARGEGMMSRPLEPTPPPPRPHTTPQTVTRYPKPEELPARRPDAVRASTTPTEGEALPGVKARPNLGRLKARPHSSILPLGSPTFDGGFEERGDFPPPPPPHRTPVRRMPLPRHGSYGKPLDAGHDIDTATTSSSSAAPPPLPPKIPVKPAKPERLRRIRTDGVRSAPTESYPDVSPSSSRGSPVEDDDGDETPPTSADNEDSQWQARVKEAMKSVARGVDPTALQQVANEIVVKGDEVHWDDIAGLEGAKAALKEAVVYPFLRPDLFSGLREPAKGMLLFGPPGTGKTMLARAVATESKSTFFSISASSLTSKYLGESEKLVRALFALAKALAPSIIFVDEIDSLLSARAGGENEASRRIKTEFLIQWSDLARAAAGKASSIGDPSRVLVLAATNLPWAIDDAARRRFARRQYIPLPEAPTRKKQLENLLAAQKHSLTPQDMEELVTLTDGYSGSDVTALAKDAAMGPLRALGEDLLSVDADMVRSIALHDFCESLKAVRPSVGKEGLRRFEEWAERFGERV